MKPRDPSGWDGTEDNDLREGRESEFWDHHIPPLATCLETFHTGPDPNTAAMFDSVAPLAGKRVLDFGCGPGVTTAWLAARGADVTGIDVAPEAVAQAADLCEQVGVKASFVVGGLDADLSAHGPFDVVVGRFVLHHVDCGVAGHRLAGLLRPGGKAAFVETMASNPVLRAARRHLVGRFGIRRVGTHDEQPLSRADVGGLEAAFGSLEIRVARLEFLSILDRQVFQYRVKPLTAACRAVDGAFHRSRRLWPLSYHQVLVLQRAAA